MARDKRHLATPFRFFCTFDFLINNSHSPFIVIIIFALKQKCNSEVFCNFCKNKGGTVRVNIYLGNSIKLSVMQKLFA